MFSKIDNKWIEKAAFFDLMLLMSAHVVSTLVQSFTGVKLYMILYGLAGVLAVAITLIKLVRDVKGKSLPRIYLWDIALLGMLLWACISTALSPERELAFFGTSERNDGLYTYFLYAAVYVCARLIADEGRRMALLRAFAGMVAAMSLVSIPQWLWGVPGMEVNMTPFAGGCYNINHFAYLLAMGIVAACGLTFAETKTAWKLLAVCETALMMWALIVNLTMGSYLAVLVGFPFLIFLMYRRNPKCHREALTLCIVILAVNLLTNALTGIISANVYASMAGIEIIDGEIVLLDSAGSARLGLWRQAFEYIKERPIFGFGPEGLYYRYIEDGFTNDRPHNEFIQHAVFLGIPALLMYLTALVSLFVARIKKLKTLSVFVLALGAVVFTYCASAFFGNTMYYTAIYYFMILGMLAGEKSQ